MKFGQRQVLKIERIKDFGAYLKDDEGQEVLLPKKQIPTGAEVGDEVDVFLYKDSMDRPIATVNQTLITLGEVKKLRVKSGNQIGAFLDIGIERDVLLPFKEMEVKVIEGDEALVALYVDRSERLAATMRIYPYLQCNTIYKKDDEVKGTVYRKKDIGIFVAVDDSIYGFIPQREVYKDYKIGDVVEARVLRVREDGKLDLSPRKRAYMQMNDDARLIYEKMSEEGGVLYLTDDSSPERIKAALGLSKNAFKRAVGNLLKEKKIRIEEDKILKI